MTKKRPTVALIYDFDRTLSPSCELCMSGRLPCWERNQYGG